MSNQEKATALRDLKFHLDHYRMARRTEAIEIIEAAAKAQTTKARETALLDAAQLLRSIEDFRIPRFPETTLGDAGKEDNRE